MPPNNVIAYINQNNILEYFQSDLRKGNSTETVILSITDILLSTLNSNTYFQLILLDIYSAFDILDHNILIVLVIYGLALKWFNYYLRTIISIMNHNYQP